MRKTFLMLAILYVSAAAAQPQAKPWEAWQPPEVVLPNPNAFDVYLRAFELKAQLDKQFPRGELAPPAAVPGAPPPPPGAAAVVDPWGEGPADMPAPDRVLLYGEVLKIVREALPLECGIEPPEGPETLLPHFQSFRGVARLFAMEAEARRLNDDYAGAAASALDCLEMAQDAKSQNIVISYLVGVACEAIALASLDQTLPGLKADEAKAALVRLQGIIAKRPPLADALTGEEAWGRQCFKRLLPDRGQVRQFVVQQMEKQVTEDELTQIIAHLPQTWQDMGSYYDRLRRNAALPYPQRDKDLAPPQDPLADLLLPNLALVLFRQTVSDTRLSLYVLALATQTYRAEHGAFPAHLGDLVPGVISAIPADPFTGGPLSSVTAGDRLKLYSLGPDGVDNHGADAGKVLAAGTKGDVVVELNVSPRR